MISSIVSSVTTTYAYDADGKRVRKGTAKLYWYGTSADVLSESDAAGTIGDEFIFFGGKRIARRDSSSAVFYYLSDHLGSSRVITQANGAVCFDADYLPFGEERPYTNTCPTPYKFTGKERDAESGLDFFIARYYSSGYGRFLSPDEFTGGASSAYSSNDPLQLSLLPYADITIPQTLNKYSYVVNNPTNFVDPNGHWMERSGGGAADRPFPWRFCGDLCVPRMNRAQAGQNPPPPPKDKGGDSPSGSGKKPEVEGGATAVLAVMGVVALADGPEPGPADAAALVYGAVRAIGATAVGVAIYAKAKVLGQKIEAHLATAEEHMWKMNNQPDWQPRGNWQKTINRVLKKAKELAEKLPPKMREEMLQRIQSIAGRCNGA